MWLWVFENYLGGLAQGIGTHMPNWTNTFFVPKSKVLKNKKVTYKLIVAYLCINK